MDKICLCTALNRYFPRIHWILFIIFVLTASTGTSRTGIPQRNSQFSRKNTGRPRPRWTIDSCFYENRNFDVTFLIDAAVNRENFRYVQRLLHDVTIRLRIEKTRTKIGLITFGVNVKAIRFKKQWRHQEELRDAINALKPALPPRRNLGKAIFAASQTVNPRSATRSFVVIIVGGRSMDIPVNAARNLNRKKARTIIVGYKQANFTQLERTASAAGSNHLIMLKEGEELIMATDSLLSAICEDLLNAVKPTPVALSVKKKALKSRTTTVQRPRIVSSSSETIHIEWENNTSPVLPKYRVSWVPKEGSHNLSSLGNTTSVVLSELNPATIYKIRLALIAKKPFGKPFGKPLTIIAATAPLPVTNLSAYVKFVEPCSLQKKLQISCEPKAARLIRVTRRATEQFLTNVKPGEEYQLAVTTRGPKLLFSEPENTSVVIPPVSPIRLDTAIVNSTAVAIRWQMPRDAIYDGFSITAVSAFGIKSYRVQATRPESSTLRPFYTYVLTDLRPDADYKLTVYTESKGVQSHGNLTTKFSTKTPSDLYNEPFLIMSGGDGIYAATTRKQPGSSESVKRMFPVTGGIVNSLYHSRWVKPRRYFVTDTGSFEWQRLLIWIERHTREIKVTDLTRQSHTATLVSGLLQPVGLTIDPYGETIYWSDIGSRSIGVASLSTRPGTRPYQVNRKLITGDLESPVSLTVAVAERYLFWGDLRGVIERSKLDGSDRTVLFRKRYMAPHSITYCEKSKMLYWIDTDTGNLESISSSGEGHKTIYSAGPDVMLALVVAGEDFVWFDEETGSIMMLPRHGDEYKEPLTIYENADIPSMTAMTSFDPDSIEKALMRESTALSFPCHMSETFCNGVCIPVTMKDAVCRGECKPWQMLCYRSTQLQCVDQASTCNGVPDCDNGEDEDLSECEKPVKEEFCGSENTSAYGCHDSGKCIPYELVCNGRLDCKDGSDEMDCPVQAQTCNFESDDLCLWKQEKKADDFDWMLHHRKTPSNHTGPILDHSMLTLNGTYLYLEATPQDEGDRAQLVSVLFAKPICVSLYYYMHGHTTGTVTLRTKDNESEEEKIIWTKSGEQGAVWNTMMVSVDKHSLYRLVIEGVRGEDYRGDIAIDDITIEDGLCHVAAECDFHSLDDAMCGYELGRMWRQVSGKIATSDSKPILAERGKPLTQDLSKVLGPEWFYYDFKSDDFPGCTACYGARLVRDISSQEYAEDGVNYVGVSLCDQNWYKIYLSETLSGPFRNIGDGGGRGEDHCEFIGGTDYAKDVGEHRTCEGNVGFRRRRWGENVEVGEYGFYRTVYFAPASYNCEFQFPRFVIDNDPKKWLEELPNSYIFLDFTKMMEKEENVKSDSIRIPIFLTNAKNVSLVEKESTVFTRNPSFSTRFQHEQIKSTSKHPTSWCLKFRYFMIGSDVETLKISVNGDYDIWVKNEEQGQAWKEATVDIPYPNVKYDLVLTASRGEGAEGSVGIDDVVISREPCHPKLSYRCIFDVVVDEDCSFEVLNGPSEQITFDILYKRSKFDPDIVRSHDYPSGVISGVGVTLGNGTNITSNPILRSPLLPKLSRFYPVLCLTVNYRQRSDMGAMSVEILSDTGQSYTLSSHRLPAQKSIIRPWLTYIAQIDDTLPHVSENPFYIEIHGLNATWINDVSLDTVECPAVVEDLCSNEVRCTNGICVAPQFLCDGINDCGDWSDEVGCSSKCGNVADYFDVKKFLDGTNTLQSNSCTHRIHGQPGKQTLLTVGAVTDLPPAGHITMKVYKGFMQRTAGETGANSGFFPNESLVFQTDKFSKNTDFLIESHNVTVVVAYSSRSLQPVRMSYEMVEEGHCSLVCPDHHCLFSNRHCDGKIGCSDGSDERDCIRLVNGDGIKVLEVRHLDGPFGPVCGDDMTEFLADAVCKQLNDLHAERPINKTRLPAFYDGVIPHKLITDYTVTDTTLIQALIAKTPSDDKIVGNASFPSQPKKTAGQCKSRDTWIPNCISYQCGVRPIDVNPFLSEYGGLTPILRIIGGKESRKGRWPWMASLLLKERDHNCGATLISERFVITAAHCFDEHSPTLFTVLLGSNTINNLGRQTSKHSIKRTIIHNEYNKNADIPDWDIALVELDPPAHFSTYISPICLPEGDMEFPPGTDCYLAGFGHVSEGRGSQTILNEAKTPIISNAECDRDQYRGSITDRMVCAGFPSTGGVGICHGDSGGPLMCQTSGSWFLVGVTSWSIGCADKGKPDVFSRILSHVGWINQVTGFNLTLPNRSKPVIGTCGGTYYGALSGTFASPGWPKKYFHNQECTYIILANLGQVIHLRFDEFETERHFDIVEIYEGDMTTRNKINGQLSGGDKPRTQNLRTPAVFVYFKSDDDTSEKGFVAHWEISGKPTPYKGPGHAIELRLKGPNPPFIQFLAFNHLGTFIYSGIGPGGWPYYLQHPPRQLTHKLEYIPQIGHWTIRTLGKPSVDTPAGLRNRCVRETPDSCGASWELWNGTAWISIQLKADQRPDITVTPPKNVITSTRHSTTTTVSRTTTTTTILPSTTTPPAANNVPCGGLLTSINGTISSPGFGSFNYSNNLNCEWFINPPRLNASGVNNTRWILLEILEIDTQISSDYLRGFPGNSTHSNPLFDISGDHVHLDEGSDDDLDILPLDVDTRDEMEPWIDVLGGLGFPFDNLPIDPAPTSLASNTAPTEPTNSANTVLIYEDTNSEGLTLTFTSDDITTGKGFALRYYVINDLTESPLNLNDYITFNVYEDEESRSRRSLIPDFSYFYLDHGSGYFLEESSGDYSEYYDYITTIKEVKPDPTCNFTIKINSTQTISFLPLVEDPKIYSVTSCLWKLKAPTPQHSFDVDITLTPYSGGIVSYLFLVGNNINEDMLRIDIAPRSVLTQHIVAQGEVLIHFSTDGQGLGFNATVRMGKGVIPTVSGHFPAIPTSVGKAVTSPTPSTTTTAVYGNSKLQTVQITSTCANVTGELEGDQFYIQSPNHPETYPGNIVCRWVLKVPTTHKIAITFIRMAIEEVSSDCSYDNVTIYNGDMKSKPVGIFCGTKIPKAIVSTGSVMIVRFATDRLIHDTGFRAIITALQTAMLPKRPPGDDTLFSCDFDDEDICGFLNKKAGDAEFIWSKQNLLTASENTGPPHDASETKDGYYLFIEASLPRVPGDRARIISPLIKSLPTESVCLSFAYSMRGLSVGSLIVYVSISSDGAMVYPRDEIDEQEQSANLFKLRPIVMNFGAGLKQDRMNPAYRNTSKKPDWQQYVLWSKTGEQEDKPWLQADITFIPNNHFQLLFEGIRGSEYQSDIAIDNIFVRRGACEKKECSANEFKCDTGTTEKDRPICISKELECDGHNDCNDGSDETQCSSPLAELCERMTNILPNTTEWMICNNVDKCNPPSVNIGHVKDIACDGVYDCFGGYDESLCQVMNKQEERKDVESSDEDMCGLNAKTNEEVTTRSEIHSIPPSSMPWVAGLYIHVPGSDSLTGGFYDENSRYLFLCSAVYIRDSWLLAPAHCILDPEMSKQDLEDFLHNREPDISLGDEQDEEEEAVAYEKLVAEPLNNRLRYDDPFFVELNKPNELVDLYQGEFFNDDVIDQSETVFEYYVIRPSKNSESEPAIHRVSKLVPHPEYTILKHLQDCNGTSKADVKMSAEELSSSDHSEDDIMCDITRINYDVTLIKIEKVESAELDISDESTQANPTVCVNERNIPKTSESEVVRASMSSTQNNMFHPPSEDVAYEKSFKVKATCYNVGFSVSNGEEGRRSDLVLSRKSVRLSYGDVSASKLICGLQSPLGPSEDCLESFKYELDFQPLLVGGYNEVRNAPLMYDQGSVLMCQSWDERWYLTGLYSWSNFYRNLLHERLYQITDDAHISGGILQHSALLGMPLGVDLFTDVSHISDWVQDTLDKDCPGEFPCYDRTSNHAQKCISKQQLCDGVIDCPLNSLDEINCASGCRYDSEVDPFGQYYKNLDEAGVTLPELIMQKYNLSRLNSSVVSQFMELGEKNPKSRIVNSRDGTSNQIITAVEDGERSWRSASQPGKIRANVVKTQKLKMCIWTIKAPPGRVAVLHVQEFSAITGGNKIQIINDGVGQSEVLQPGMSDVYYTSTPGGTLTVRILPPKEQPYLTEIRYFEANHHTEAVGICKGRHKCGNGACVSQHHVCDGVWDCKDKTDEINCKSGCGGPAFLSGPSSGTIESKKYPLRHNGNGDCEWQFVSKAAGGLDVPKIRFEFIDFTTDAEDLLFLFSGAGVRKSAQNLLGVYSGDRQAFNVTVHAKSATILLRSNDFISSRRFRIKYSLNIPS